MKDKKLFYWEIAGIVFISVVGSLFHFTYEWSNKDIFVAYFSAVNESVWEHMKMGYMAALLFAIIEFFAMGIKYKNFITAKVASFYLYSLLIPLLFYTYTSFIGKNITVLDILIFIISVAAAQYLSYKIIEHHEIDAPFRYSALLFGLLILLAYSLFTYSPPRYELFKDPITSKYGIEKSGP